jgi:ABC-type antimicrobial peptide transport system permease subunit
LQSDERYGFPSVRRFVTHGVTLAVFGELLGLAAAAGATQLMAAVLYDVQPVPPTFAAVAVGLTVVAVIASYLLARRASAVDPAESLAAE